MPFKYSKTGYKNPRELLLCPAHPEADPPQPMPPPVQHSGAHHLPVSRDLVRIIRESSKLEGPNLTLNDHMKAVDDRQAKAVEFYLRACALRLDQGL